MIDVLLEEKFKEAVSEDFIYLESKGYIEKTGKIVHDSPEYRITPAGEIYYESKKGEIK